MGNLTMGNLTMGNLTMGFNNGIYLTLDLTMGLI